MIQTKRKQLRGSLYFLIMRGYIGFIVGTILIFAQCFLGNWYITSRLQDKYFSAANEEFSYAEEVEIGSGKGTLMVRSMPDGYGISDLMVLNPNGTVAYSNSNISKEEFKEKIRASEDNNTTLAKRYDAYYTLKNRVDLGTGVVFMILEAAMMLLIVFRVNRTVSKPLMLLDGAMEKIRVGREEDMESIVYDGPRELRNICDSYNAMLSALKTSNHERISLEEGRQRMLAGISHDLKTPITVIQGYSRAIVDGTIPEERWKSYGEIIYRKSGILSELINTFHEYSRLEHPDFQYHMEEGDLVEYLREYLAGKYEELAIGGYGLEVNLPEKCIKTCFDRTELKRVFENIINNTLRHTSTGTEIYASLEERENCTPEGRKKEIVIYVGDDGDGIPDEVRETIFDAFVTGDASRKSGKGSGLGLTIARKITIAHGGSIRLMAKGESPYPTTYEIVLPQKR